MARPKKTGLDYFPLDVEFDDKFKAVEMLHGNNGFVFVIKIWQAAYKTLTGEVSLSGLFAELMAKNCRITTEEFNKILETSLNIELFFKTESGMITSNGIKKRISSVSKDRETAIIRQQNKDKKKVKESIVNKSKVKETPHYSANNPRITHKELPNNEIIAHEDYEEREIESERAAEEGDKEERRKTKKETCFSFEEFWEAYKKPVGKKTSIRLYEKVSEENREKIKEHLPKYTASKERQYRKDPERYLKYESWNDEIINRDEKPEINMEDLPF
jgi:hypothetical protein